ncbi:MAG: S8 family serine peptidase [Ignavibacterium sp.]|jgi:subtilisin family serine protease|nr:MAG: S8 family serine peptidase [Ignavibacterium sp.]MDD5608005.1 S8 family serine peptidase [Ignavibacterium sp.]MDX9712454.1 S8 family serine peptidase [Ignavibacteriaceae bacterium]MEB2354469.1 S8 family serine peptidase [Ignavibacteriales bacterium]
MKNLFTTFFLAAFLLISQTESLGQTSDGIIHPYLQVILLSASDNEMINVYATFKEQYSLKELQQETVFLSKKERQKEVVRILKNFSNQHQQNVRGYLENAKQQSLVSKIDVLWAANTIVFSAVPSVIYNLAKNFNEIAEIRFDPIYDGNQLIDPIDQQQESSSDDVLALQPGLTLINVPAVWAAGDSGQGVLVGNLDDGCDWRHPDLVHNIWNNLGEDANGNGVTIVWNGSSWVFDPGDLNGIDDDGNGYIDDVIGWDFWNNDNNVYYSSSSHGTSTSGIVCGDGTNGTQTGVAPRAKILALRPNGESQYWLAQQYAIDKGVDVITSSLSYKWYFNPQPNYPMFRQMTDVELAAGVVHTNSTSNDGNNLGSAPIPFNISAPGNSPSPWIHPDQTLTGGLSSVIGVGNVNASTDLIVSSSPYGPATWEEIKTNHPSYPYVMPVVYQDYPYETVSGSIGLIKPDISAPGNGTTSTVNGTGYGSFSGTSGATPHAGGTAALLLSVNPNLTPADVSMILQTTSIEKGASGKDNRYGAGRIDAYAAYLLALSMIPVELTSFSASADQNSVILSWSTATETNNAGFSVERKTPVDERWIEIGFVPGFGTTTEVRNYSYTDVNLLSGLYSYRLKQIDYDGSVEYSNDVFAEIGLPETFSLMQNYPNPFNPTTNIKYAIVNKQFVTLKVYDVLGNEVVTLVNEYKPAGNYEINFDASELSSGVYYYQLKTGSSELNSGQSFIAAKKMLLLK